MNEGRSAYQNRVVWRIILCGETVWWLASTFILPIPFVLDIGFEIANYIVGVALVNSWHAAKLLVVPRILFLVGSHHSLWNRQGQGQGCRWMEEVRHLSTWLLIDIYTSYYIISEQKNLSPLSYNDPLK